MHVKTLTAGKLFALLLIQLCLLNTPLTALLDLEARSQDFVLSSKQIFIPGYPDAFNPSIVRWQDGLLMSFRFRDPITKSTDAMALVWLDNNFDLISSPQIIKRIAEPFNPPSRGQDPRLIVIEEALYIVYNNFVQTPLGENRRMMIGKVIHEEGGFVVRNPEPLLDFPENDYTHQEKNWVPFEYQGKLLLSYSLTPHHVLKPLLGKSQQCESVAITKGAIKWKWGELRGGTMALREGDHYLAFFHSSTTLATTHSKGEKMPHYVMGAYLFDSQPPFPIKKISPEPLVGNGFYSGPPYPTWKPLRVVFPGGFISDEDYIWVVYGKQDFETWVVKIDKKELLNSLVPVSEIK